MPNISLNLDLKHRKDKAMNRQVEQIRAEIERRMNCFKNERNTLLKASDNNLSLGARIAMCEELLVFIDSLQEEPVNEDKDLEETINTIKLLTSNTALLTFEYGFRKGAEWQNEKDKSLSDDLGEYINELSKQFPEMSFAKLSRIAVRVAKWQMAQMMKDATDVTVHADAGGYPYIPQMELYDYDKDIPLAKEGDKYNVVLIKKD